MNRTGWVQVAETTPGQLSGWGRLQCIRASLMAGVFFFRASEDAAAADPTAVALTK